MQTLLMLVVVLHVIPAVFWAGSTFVLARGIAGTEPLVSAQLGAAVVATVFGVILWSQTHAYTFDRPEEVLAIGAACAIAAAGVQSAVALPAVRKLGAADAAAANVLRARITIAQRIAAGVLVITLVAMTVARYV